MAAETGAFFLAIVLTARVFLHSLSIPKTTFTLQLKLSPII